jgi:simple sugar transport system ATP-binding protein
VQGLLESFDALRRDGYAVVLIAHKLQEVLGCADRITVMRRGRVAGTLSRAEASESVLVHLMFGAEVAPATPDRERPGDRRWSHDSAPRATDAGRDSPPLLELRDVSTRAEGRGIALDGIRLSIRPGEIAGVAGVSGNGQRELGDVILGLLPCAAGAKYLRGREATRWSVARIRASGVAFIPEDALHMAAVPSLTALQNMALGDTRRYARAGGLAMDWPAVRRDLETALGKLGASLSSLDSPAGALSGGNVQRMILARETAHASDLLVAFYPTRGLDVRSAAAARELLVRSRDRGAGVLLISEDLEELFALSDRLAVLRQGRIVATPMPRDVSLEEIGYLMTGASRQP